MPVTVPIPYRTYDALRSAHALDLSGTRCPDASCREATGGIALSLTKATVLRWVVLLECDAYAELEAVRLRVWICLARCSGCSVRVRVLPCDVLPWKQYAAPVIEQTMSLYRSGDLSLRQAVTKILGDRTPVHSSLHAWLEGLGAFALGFPTGELPGCAPASNLLAETAAHVPAVLAVAAEGITIPPVRYRSDARHERLAASFVFLAIAVVAAAGCQSPGALTEWCRLLVGWVQGATSPLAFRSALRSTRFEHRDRADRASSRSGDQEAHKRWPSRTRSPPGGSNR